jgi:hypothetical protein
MDLADKANELIRLHIKKRDIASDLAKLDIEYEGLERELYSAFVSQKIDTYTINGYTLKPVIKFTAAAKDEKTIRVLRRRGYKELVKPSIHPGTAHSFIRKVTDENNGKIPQWVSDNFKISSKETISIRKD